MDDFNYAQSVELMGFKSLEEYYTKASFGPKIQDIETPVFFLNALDDFFGYSGSKFVIKNPNVFAATTISGGHVTFMSGFLLPYLWYN